MSTLSKVVRYAGLVVAAGFLVAAGAVPVISDVHDGGTILVMAILAAPAAIQIVVTFNRWRVGPWWGRSASRVDRSTTILGCLTPVALFVGGESGNAANTFLLGAACSLLLYVRALVGRRLDVLTLATLATGATFAVSYWVFGTNLRI
jgi:hypothetical protein